VAKELARIRAIDRELARLRDRYVRVCVRWDKVNRERRALDAQANKLIEERQSLAQGQLLIPFPRRRRAR
jgi:hypothetical protein